jgi:hypothetical protein
MAGEQFLGRQPKQDKWGWKPFTGARTFQQSRSDTDTVRDRDPGMDSYQGATERVKARLEADDGNMAKLFGTVPAPTVEDRQEHDVIDSAIGAVVEKATHGRQSRAERDRAYLVQARESRAQAESAAKTVKQEQRWAAQEARETQVKEWLEGKSEDEINRLLSSEQFNSLPELAQNRIHVALDELGYAAQAEVDVNVQALEENEAESQFTMPTPTEPLPWEERPQPAEYAYQDEDNAEENDDDDDLSQGFAGRF